MAAEPAAERRGARRDHGTRVVTPTISVRQRLREIWLSRELLVYLVRTEIKVKYKNSVLGLVWSMVAPAMTLAIYFFVFQVILNNEHPALRHLPVRRAAALEPLLSWASSPATGVVVEQRRDREEGRRSPARSSPWRRSARPACSSSSRSIVMVIFMVVLHHGPDWPTSRCSSWRWWRGIVAGRRPSRCSSRRSTSTCATRST